jgi:uncharacterized protein DUF2764
MMDKYYYFVAQLPTLLFDQAPLMDIESFLAESEKWLGSRDYGLLSKLDIDDAAARAGDPAVLAEYKAFEFGLRTELALWRKARSTDQEYSPMGFPSSILREGTPLDIERALLRLRWDYIEKEESEHHFDLGVLISYLLKLQILRRLLTFDGEEGMKTFRNLCEVEV